MWLMGLVAPRHVGSSQTRARTRVPCISRQTPNHCATREAQSYHFWCLITYQITQLEIWLQNRKNIPPSSQVAQKPMQGHWKSNLAVSYSSSRSTTGSRSCGVGSLSSAGHVRLKSALCLWHSCTNTRSCQPQTSR